MKKRFILLLFYCTLSIRAGMFRFPLCAMSSVSRVISDTAYKANSVFIQHY